jgi:hypothetical protein
MSDEIDPITKRVCDLIRRFAANESEAKIAVVKLRNFFDREKLSFNNLATVIEKGARGYYTREEVLDASDKSKRLGEQEGYAKAKRETWLPPEYYNADGEVRWYEMVFYIDKHKDRLRGWDRKFVEGDPQRGSLLANIAKFHKPTAGQIPFVLGIFIKLGGTVPPEVMRQYKIR